MIIKLKCFDDEIGITLTNEELDNDNFVDLMIGDQVATVSIDDLSSAVGAFEQLRIMNNHRE